MSLFKYGVFKGAGGISLDFKINCDYLSTQDWNCIARVAVEQRLIPNFGKVIGVPRGGIALATAFEPYLHPNSNVTLVVDDVWTTGTSMLRVVHDHGLPYSANRHACFVAFMRSIDPLVDCAYFMKCSPLITRMVAHRGIEPLLSG